MIEDSVLIERVLAGDTRSFASIVDRYKDMVYALSMRIAKNREDAEDLTQEIFVKVYMGLPSFKGECRFSTWLFRIAYNQAIGVKREIQIQTSPIEDYTTFDEDGYSPSINAMEEMNSQDRIKYIQMALDRMKEKEAFVLTLFYLNEHSVAEISEICNVSVANVKVLLHRARTHMGEILTQILDKETIANLT